MDNKQITSFDLSLMFSALSVDRRGGDDSEILGSALYLYLLSLEDQEKKKELSSGINKAIEEVVDLLESKGLTYANYIDPNKKYIVNPNMRIKESVPKDVIARHVDKVETFIKEMEEKIVKERSAKEEKEKTKLVEKEKDPLITKEENENIFANKDNPEDEAPEISEEIISAYEEEKDIFGLSNETMDDFKEKEIDEDTNIFNNNSAEYMIDSNEETEAGDGNKREENSAGLEKEELFSEDDTIDPFSEDRDSGFAKDRELEEDQKDSDDSDEALFLYEEDVLENGRETAVHETLEEMMDKKVLMKNSGDEFVEKIIKKVDSERDYTDGEDR